MDGWTGMIVQDRTARWSAHPAPPHGRMLARARWRWAPRGAHRTDECSHARAGAGRDGVHTCCDQGSAGIMAASERVAVVGSEYVSWHTRTLAAGRGPAGAGGHACARLPPRSSVVLKRRGV